MDPQSTARPLARIRIGEWEVDPALDEIRRGAEIVKLEPRKMQLLMALARRPGELVTTEQLFDEVWKDVVVTQSSVYQSIAQLRRVLGDDIDAPRYIVTVPRKGYRLIAPVEPVRAVRVESKPVATAPEAAPPLAPAVTTSLVTAGIAQPATDAARPVARRWFLAGAAAVGTVGVGLGAWWWRSRPHANPTQIAIAVLPFEDISTQKFELALADGLADDMIGLLARHQEVRVTARASAFQFRVSVPPTEVRQKLGVTHVLAGEVLRFDDRLRLTVRLLDASTANLVWRDAIEVPAEQAASLPRRVVADALRALRVPGLAQLPALPTAEAYELLLLGRHHLQPGTIEAIRKARDYFQRVIDIDAGCAPGYTALASTWISEYHFGAGLAIRSMDARAQPLLDRALALEPELPEALGLQGHLKSVLAQFEQGRPFLQRALALAPHSASVLLWMGVNEAGDGYPREALTYYARAVALDPMRFIVHVRAGLESIHAGLYDDAQNHYARAVELAPKHPNTHWGAGILGFARGRLDDAVRGYQAALAVEWRREDLWTQLAWIYLDLGEAKSALDAFERALALAGSRAQGLLAMARTFMVRGDLAGMARHLDRHQQPTTGVRDAEIDAALLFIVLGRHEAARAALEAAVGPMLADPIPLFGPWGTFLGHQILIDVAAVYSALGEAQRAEPFLDQAQSYVDRYERQGNVWHATGYHQARIAALRGRPDAALDALDKAVGLGWRRGWWLLHDPALASLRNAARFGAIVARIDRINAEKRTRLPKT